MINGKMKTISLILATLICSTALVGCKTISANNQSTTNQTTNENSNVKLEKLGWAKDNYNALEKVIEDNGKGSKNYVEDEKPYAVFDWDNTSILNDVEEALLAYQLMNLEFKMTPEEFSKVIRTKIPKENFKKEFNNKEGKPVNIDLIGTDIDADYKYLYENYKGFKGNKSLEEIKNTNEYKSFITKVRYLYAAIGDTFSSEISYPWVTYLFAGMNSDEVAKLTDKSNDYWLKESLGEETWTSPDEHPGKAGIVSVTFKTGLRTTKEMQNLYKTLMKNGFDVYICSASYIDVVKEFATNSKYGYELPDDHIYAMELKKDSNGIIEPEYNNEYYQTQGAGKVETIKKFLISTHKQEPIIVGGDSNGDVPMLSDFKNTKISLIINRCKDGKIGTLCKKAADTIGKSDARYYLQGRNENNGDFTGNEESILLGSDTEQLLN
ncbi:haloacid dehalogenase-like hydrolase [Clostridium tarantellae]|uniref:phosphoserine phosphatase n=1 Tax=Clostridium tarantellae TaxID=39493 RepID=A0A6I1MKC3_9CLOT|nr:haloacid dehalogenase-like hydrolase [Clostridium tarantellae]MPQ43480.1 haloacid dehalogenase-like hydrolase [Clostridium tarantellae]